VQIILDFSLLHFMPEQAELKGIADKFQEAFGDLDGVIWLRAPGRVNLIGEHTDYNDGFVLPLATQQEIVLAVRRRDDSEVKVYSLHFAQAGGFDLEKISFDTRKPWINYARGVAWSLLEAGYDIGGIEAVVGGDVPIGAGLSSSAAVEVGFALAFSHLYDLKIKRGELARLCHRAEREFVGLPCGMMDQVSSLMAGEGAALFLDCRSLEYKLVPFADETVRVVICDTKVRRELTHSAYHQRVQECNEAVRLLKKHLPQITHLRDVNLEELEKFKSELPEVIYCRARHIVSENERVLRAVEALEGEVFGELGRLMDASHQSLKEDYEVSCRELDLMVELAREIPGTLGARLTGGGFGGATVNLVASSAIDDFKREVSRGYKKARGLTPDIFVSRPAAKAGLISGCGG
jgi:galactokinase